MLLMAKSRFKPNERYKAKAPSRGKSRGEMRRIAIEREARRARAPALSRMARREAVLLEDGRRLGAVMDPWQREDFQALDDPAHRHAYLERPRGHSKTSDAATEAFLAITDPGKRDQRLYAVAVDEDQ